MKDLNTNITNNTKEKDLRPLPEGWVWTTLGKLRKDTRESLNPAKNLEQFFELYSIPSFDDRMPEIVLGREIGSSKQVVHPGEVMVCKINPRINRAWVVGNHSENPKIASTEWIVFDKKEGLESRFLCFFLQTDAVRDYLAANVSGVGGSLMRARVAAIEDYPFPLPPLPEQERIVARLEELLSDLEAGIAALERARVGAARYKRSVLKVACEGKLISNTGLGNRELPEGWRWAKLPELGLLARGKSKHRPRNAEFLYGGPYPFIQTGDIRHADGFITKHSQTYSEAGLAQSKLWPKGTLCITIAANIAETAILGFDSCFPDSVVGFVPNDNVDVKYVEFYFRTIKESLERFAPATAQKNINLDVLQKVLMALPPLEEQRRIVTEVEWRLESVRTVEEAVEAGLKRAGRLRQAVLRSAFEGTI